MDKEFNNTRTVPAQARANLDDSYSRLPTTTSKRVAVPRSISSSPTRAVGERPVTDGVSPGKEPRNPAIGLVLPRPDSPTGSNYADVDEDMKSLLLELSDLVKSCPLPPVQKVRSSSSDKALVGKQPSRGRQRLLPPVASTANLEASRNLSGSGLHRGKTLEELPEDPGEYRGPAGKGKQQMPRNIVADYADKPVRQSRSNLRSIESRRTGSSG